MKRRTFIAKGIGAGLVAGASRPLLAADLPVEMDKSEKPGLTTEAMADEELPCFWDQLTALDFKKAVAKARGVCLIPIGVMEKHGPHLPLGTDVIRAHEMCRRAAGQEYAIIFPDFYVGQILEAKHQPGTIAYSTEMMLRFLDETCREIARNGLKKIILVNTHGGNGSLLPYFLQIQLESPRDYAVFLFQLRETPETQERIKALRKSTTGGHADEIETAEMLRICPEYVRMDQVNAQSGRDLERLDLPNVSTGISWYSRYPNHYAGESSGATPELGELRLTTRSQQLVEAIKAVKADTATIRLQNEFFRQSAAPLETEEWDTEAVNPRR